MLEAVGCASQPAAMARRMETVTLDRAAKAGQCFEIGTCGRPGIAIIAVSEPRWRHGFDAACNLGL